MPIAAYQEVTHSWSLGKIICDIWTIFDVLVCTASILHLVAIAFDRYWAITSLDYGAKRTAKRIFSMIGIIWCVASATAISPHLFGLSYDPTNKERCHLTDNLPYQMVSTLAAFYLPLIVMCTIYWKIFQSAKFRIRKKAFGTNANNQNKQLKSDIKANKKSSLKINNNGTTPSTVEVTTSKKRNSTTTSKSSSQYESRLLETSFREETTTNADDEVFFQQQKQEANGLSLAPESVTVVSKPNKVNSSTQTNHTCLTVLKNEKTTHILPSNKSVTNPLDNNLNYDEAGKQSKRQNSESSFDSVHMEKSILIYTELNNNFNTDTKLVPLAGSEYDLISTCSDYNQEKNNKKTTKTNLNHLPVKKIHFEGDLVLNMQITPTKNTLNNNNNSLSPNYTSSLSSSNNNTNKERKQVSISNQSSSSAQLSNGTGVHSNTNGKKQYSAFNRSSVSSMLAKKAKIDIKRERKAAKTLGFIMFSFIICWLPFFIMQIFFAICKNCYLTSLIEASSLPTLLTWLGYINSLLNPVVYTVFSPDFRSAFAKILYGKYHRKSFNYRKR
jgi:hypothetical protein